VNVEGSVGWKEEEMAYKYRDPILKFTHQGLMFQSVDSKIRPERSEDLFNRAY